MSGSRSSHGATWGRLRRSAWVLSWVLAAGCQPPTIAGTAGGLGGAETDEAEPAPARIDARPVPGDAAADAVGNADLDSRDASRNDTDSMGGTDAAPLADAADAQSVVPSPLPSAYDTAILHRVTIDIASQHLATIDQATKPYVPCNVVFDGVTLPTSACARQGYSSAQPVAQKSSFNVKFDGYDTLQTLHGIGKVTLRNCMQDPSFLNEHLAYEIERRSGVPAPLTSHAFVTVNGRPYGLFLVREPVNKDFLARNFGRINRKGNLYEGEFADFLTDPTKMILKNEVEEMRSRDDIKQLAALFATAPDATFVETMSPKLRLDAYITEFAVEAVLSHWDSYHYGQHNYYVYDNPADGKFVMIPTGADWIFSPRTTWPNAKPDPTLDPYTPVEIVKSGTTFPGKLAVKVQTLPALRAKFYSEVRRVITEVWDVPALQARIDQASKVIRSLASPQGRNATDIATFSANVANRRDYVAKRKEFVQPRLR